MSNVDKYENLQKIGEGTIGGVFKVMHRVTNQHFALKRIRLEQEEEKAEEEGVSVFVSCVVIELS